MTGAKQLQTYTTVPAEVIGGYYGWLFALCCLFVALEVLSTLASRLDRPTGSWPDSHSSKPIGALHDDGFVDRGSGSTRVHPIGGRPTAGKQPATLVAPLSRTDSSRDASSTTSAKSDELRRSLKTARGCAGSGSSSRAGSDRVDSRVDNGSPTPVVAVINGRGTARSGRGRLLAAVPAVRLPDVVSEHESTPVHSPMGSHVTEATSLIDKVEHSPAVQHRARQSSAAKAMSFAARLARAVTCMHDS